jgi:uncharacterized protein (DUF1684 family)
MRLLAFASFLTTFFFTVDPAYVRQLDEWHEKRVASLKREDGWLNLAGLFWLKEGDNTAGSVSDNSIVFPSGAAHTGVFHLENGIVSFTPATGTSVTTDGVALSGKTEIFSSEKKPKTLQQGSLKWFIIKRGDRYGIRLRDLESENLKQFHGIERFPVAERYRVKARFEKPTEAKTIRITDIIGLVSDQPLAGTLAFELDGKTYRLDATGEGKLFVVFGDKTNGRESYGAGRFLYADQPGPDGTTVLDFNQAINPPCAFTPYATCPLPPVQNKLAVRIPAGEKNYGNH